MNQAGVWSFRTTTGVARVVDGSLRQRHTLRGIVTGAYSRLGSGSILRNAGIGLGSFGAVGPIRSVIEAVITDGPIAGAVSVGLAALLITTGTAVMLSVPIVSIFRPESPVDIYDIVDVTADADDYELTIQYTDDAGDRETTTVDLADEEALGEAVLVLQLKGAPVDEALVDEWA